MKKFFKQAITTKAQFSLKYLTVYCETFQRLVVFLEDNINDLTNLDKIISISLRNFCQRDCKDFLDFIEDLEEVKNLKLKIKIILQIMVLFTVE